MSRIKKVVALSSASNADDLSAQKKNKLESLAGGDAAAWIARSAFVLSIAAIALSWQPFGLSNWIAAGTGFVAALLLMLAEMRMRRVEISGLAGGAAGLIFGIVAAALVCLVIS